MAEIQVNGITEQDFNLWKHQPVSKLVFRYFADKKKFIQEAALEQWFAGLISLGEKNAECLRGQIIELAEHSELPFEAIVSFYYQEEEENGA